MHVSISFFSVVIAIEWELDVYMFDEGGNSTYQICAVANDTIIGDRVEERFVVYRNGSATGWACLSIYSHTVVYTMASNSISIEFIAQSEDFKSTVETDYVELCIIAESERLSYVLYIHTPCS